MKADKEPGSLVSPESSFGTLCETRSLPEAPAACTSSSVPTVPSFPSLPRPGTSCTVPTGPNPHRVTSSGHRVPTIPSMPQAAAPSAQSHQPFPLHPAAASTAVLPVSPHSHAARGPPDQGWRGEYPAQSAPAPPLYRPPEGGDSRRTGIASERDWDLERGSDAGGTIALGSPGQVVTSAAGCAVDGDDDASEPHGPVEIDPGLWSPTTSRASSAAWRSCGSLSEHVAGPVPPATGCPRAFGDPGYQGGAARTSQCRPCERTHTFRRCSHVFSYALALCTGLRQGRVCRSSRP